jgi:phosphatidylserine synthase 1
MVFPNGPFIRPHPIFWRIVFGVSVLYTLLLQFTVYQSFADVKAVLSWIDPVGLSHEALEEKVHFKSTLNFFKK